MRHALSSRLLLAGLVALSGLAAGCMTAKPVAPISAPAVNPVQQASAAEAQVVPPGGSAAVQPNRKADKPAELPAPRPAPVVPNTAPAKPGEAARLTAAFNNKVIYAPDPTRGGALMPGMLGRLYIFSTDEGVPIAPPGELLVDLYDNSPATNGGQPKLLEVWHIDAVSFAKFRKRDIIGEGYSLFLPWSTYHIDIKQVNMVVRFTGADGRVLLSPPEGLAIDHAATLQRAAEKIGVTMGDGGQGKPKDLPTTIK